MRPLHVVVLGSIAIASAASGCFLRPSGPVCSDCAGCCDADGRCVAGDSALECGSGGESCTTCGSGQSCAALSGGGGECRASSNGCDAFSCDGCCTTDGTCASGLADDTCGYAAASCVTCASGSQCQAWSGGGHCVRLDSCTPFNCDGCCTDAGECLSGTSDAACGNGGDRCVPCDAPALCEATGTGGGICR